MFLMFTGIIQHVGRVVRSVSSADGIRIDIDLGPLGESTGLGASVAVNGACLTVSSLDGSVAGFDVSTETLSRTTLGRISPAEDVNLELPLPAGAPLAGHIVTGHVDGLCRMIRLDKSSGATMMTFQAGRELTDKMVEKGSIALDGVSLTLVEVMEESFSVALIPFTLEHTTLGQKRIGEFLNVELDIIGKYVRRYFELLDDTNGRGVTMEILRRYGFA